MSYNQRRIGMITLILVVITCAVALVCFKPPYKVNTWLALGSLVLSELIFGISWIVQVGRSKSVLPVALGGVVLNGVYVLFALVCTFLTGIDCAYYALIQVVGFLVFVGLNVFARMAEHHVEEMAKEDEPDKKIERANVTWR